MNGGTNKDHSIAFLDTCPIKKARGCGFTFPRVTVSGMRRRETNQATSCRIISTLASLTQLPVK